MVELRSRCHLQCNGRAAASSIRVLFDVAARVISSTLSQFQVTNFDAKRFFFLVRSLNRLRPQSDPEHDLQQRFDRLWPSFEIRSDHI